MALVAAGLVCTWSTGASFATSAGSSAFAVPATSQLLTTNHRSVVAHDNETMAIVAHAGRLFAATDQWEYPGPSAAGQVLVKNAKTSSWAVFQQTRSLRVQALDSFPIPRDQAPGSRHSLLITQAIVNGRSRIEWLLDRAASFTPSRSYALSATSADVRAFGAHESRGVWAVYAGVDPTGIVRGLWSPRKKTLVFNPRPELTVAPPGAPGLKTQKVTGFADCAGALYVSINTKLFRRNDGTLPPGVARWTLVYQAAPVGPHNSGLRGLTCVRQGRSPALLVSTEGNGDVYRLTHLPRGQLDGAGAPKLPAGLVASVEFSPIRAIAKMLAAEGTPVPSSGRGSIHYVIAAYNSFPTVKLGGTQRQLFGIEWNYQGVCAPTRTCEPGRFFDAAACFAVRTDAGPSPTYVLRCLSGPQFRTSGKITTPVRYGQAFVSIRTITPSPFGDSQLYYGGYDCNFYPADGTAWIATSTLSAVHPANDPNAIN